MRDTNKVHSLIITPVQHGHRRRVIRAEIKLKVWRTELHGTTTSGAD